MMKHTPAPWVLEKDEDKGSLTLWMGSACDERYSGCYDSAGEIELYTCIDFEEPSISDYEMLANARLLSAAPDLLEALEKLVYAKSIKGQPEYQEAKDAGWKMANEAIKKARGL